MTADLDDTSDVPFSHHSSRPPVSGAPQMTRRELIERLERASAPDRELDSRIEVASGLARYRDGKGRACYHDGKRDRVPHYTASLDAAVAFCARVLPDFARHEWSCGFGMIAGAPRARVALYSEDRTEDDCYASDIKVSAKTLPIALCLAALRALEAKEGT